MRLLELSDTGEITLTKDDDPIPPYAILSHTWEEGQEVTFRDLIDGTGLDKVGYNKIQFCGQQAKRDGLRYFWVDTCCIDKSNPVELQSAIDSMFRWYQGAERCYVFLSDVSTLKRKAEDNSSQCTWERAFWKSRWFTRGWTLQELLAPISVEFFSREQKKLGDKRSLGQQIRKITGIPDAALKGARLSHFSDKERFLWIQYRKVTVEEDKAYSLLGIFDIKMPLRYGEGSASAFKRLEEEIDKLNKCLRDLRLTDPRDDKKRIEDIKGGLLEDSYCWILENPNFQQWRNNQQSRLLWIKGDPGKGKTMLLCGIINELKKSTVKTNLLSYFFCQATDSRINNATAVLRGLLYLLANQQPSLVSHIRKKHDHAGKSLFEDANAWTALSKIFTNTLQDPSLDTIYLVVDALDECIADMPKLLSFIAQQSSASPRVKWIVSSRNWPNIEEQLERAVHKVRLCLELNAKSVSAAVSTFTRHKVFQLAEQKKYDNKTRDAVQSYLSLHADDTFLWVALVCQNLEKIPRWKAVAELNVFPPGLDSLYERMIEHLHSLVDYDLSKQILAFIAVVYQPITLQELTSLVEMLDIVDDLASVRDIISFCGSFLTVRDDTVYFVHQSAKDFLFKKAFDTIFPSGREKVHHTIFLRSLQVMSRTLRRDMYNLGSLGYPAELVTRPDPDPLAASRYSSIYWVDHLYDSNLTSLASHNNVLYNGGIVDVFLQKKFLYWLEGLSLCKSVPKGVVSVEKLWLLIQRRGDASAFTELVKDAHRFIMYHKGAIEYSPLQAYVSALLFSPTKSWIRRHFQHEELGWLMIKPAMGDGWSACLQTLEGHSSYVNSVAFSHDSTRLASASNDRTVKIWDASSGACLQTLEGHSRYVNLVAFSHDSTRLASASLDRTVKIWDASSGACLQTLNGHSGYANLVAFSHDSTRLASASYDRTVKIWNASSGACLQTLKGHSRSVKSVAFSHDSTQLASASDDCTVKIWNASSSACLQTLDGHSRSIKSVAFSHNSTRLASASDDRTVKIWDASSGACLQTLNGHSRSVNLVAFSHDSTRLASASYDRTAKIWDASSGACLQTLDVGNALRNISFDTTGLYLYTNIGAISSLGSRDIKA
ncbi:HET-D [Mytilinidion resinicola]|uniref:HET-D n=1 Tax=Mytilinidion resinicola TaxID=574789 RepID=A0A6A6YSM9_9PEZI|nr:HET-D [Mytilinidion resinicola]KAF2811373.1 HET-D [Mytilinidion resinicola]